MGRRRFDVMGVLDATGSNFNVANITVTSTATAIPSSKLENRKAISIRNNSDSVTIYLGESGVTTATGYPVLPKEQMSFDLGTGASIYGICDTGLTADVRYIEIDNT